MFRAAIAFFVLLQVGCGQQNRSESEESVKPETGISFVDDYLRKWDRFAQGENDVASQIKDQRKQFESELSSGLKREPKTYVPRTVFYGVVQVGGFFDAKSELGIAIKSIAGNGLQIADTKGKDSYFAGDIYFWWEKTADQWSRYPLLEEWRQRDFAKQVVLPMYRSAATSSNSGDKKTN